MTGEANSEMATKRKSGTTFLRYVCHLHSL
jgi:hypothetical protein